MSSMVAVADVDTHIVAPNAAAARAVANSPSGWASL